MCKKNKFALPVLLLYTAGLFLGIALCFFIPYITHKSQLQGMAERCAINCTNQASIRHINDYGISYIVYDAAGNCIDKSLLGPEINYDGLTTGAYLSELSRTDYFQHYAFLKTALTKSSLTQSPFPFLRDPYLVCGHTISDAKGNRIGALILVRPLTDLNHNIFGYVISLTFLTVMYYIFLHMYRKKATELEERERMYLAGMNHELKSPITSIKALSETLLDGMVTDPQKQFLYYNTILKEATQLETTVQDILDFTRLQTKKVSYPKSALSFDEVFGEILLRYEELQPDMDFTLHLPDISTAQLPELFTNKELMAQLLDLLLHNAVKFLDAEGEIWIGLRLKKKQIVVSVRDNGCGIPKAELPHVFEHFYKVEHSHASGGSGLGLSIAKGITEYLNESIWIESEPGTGTVASFTVGTAAKHA